ncbi:MAG: hypothetical protein ACOX5A_03830 [Aminivibrio sp.]|jgi:hypothetical protein
MQRPKLRDNRKKKPFELYPLGRVPGSVLIEIGKWITYRYTVGQSDIDGEDWGDIFAKAIGGEHLAAPLGLADVVYGSMAWSAKSIKHRAPHEVNRIRIISGRCSPDYSFDITDPYIDIKKTGDAVLSIYNERINIAKERYEPLRTIVLIRNLNTMEFSLFEHDTTRYNTEEYDWRINSSRNFEGFDLIDNKHRFTWQPHGSQFTIIYDVPATTPKFRIIRPPILDFNDTMKQIGFEDDWVTIL